ncbi:hypothetical protein Dimus_000474, partial [Dionaea muscipula]
YILKNIIGENRWLRIKIVSAVASRFMEKFYQPYQIWNVYLVSQNPVGFEGCQSTREEVLAIDPLRYQVDCYRQFFTELNELKVMYECGVVVPSFFDGRRIVCIEDYRIRLNLSSKLGLRSHNLDLDKLKAYWNVCRTLLDFPTDVLTAAFNIVERIENVPLGDFIHPYDDEQDQDIL